VFFLVGVHFLLASSFSWPSKALFQVGIPCAQYVAKDGIHKVSLV